MGSINYFFTNTILTTTIICFVTFPVRSNPVKDIVTPSQDILMNSNERTTLNAENMLHCETQEYQLTDVIILENNDVILTKNNFTVHSSKYHKMESKLLVCLQKISCTEKFTYIKTEYRILPNNSAVIGKDLVPENEYEINGDVLLTCTPHYEDEEDSPPPDKYLQRVSTVLGVIGSIISIAALIAHLSTFAYLPSLKNLSGFSLGSLSVSLLLAYIFILLGLIPHINHVFCIICAILQQYLFLVVYFWMNLMSFDIWKTLKKATDFLIFVPSKELRKHFIWYSVYSWGLPLIPTIVSVIGDNVDGFHPGFKPEYGKDDTCWIGNSFAKGIFFSLPSFALFMINCSLLSISACMITSHGMKGTKDESKLIVRSNYFFYVRLALMLGLIWLLCTIALIKENEVLWLIADIFGSLQGLFLLIIFVYSKRITKQISEKRNKKMSVSKQPIAEKNLSVSAETKNESEL